MLRSNQDRLPHALLQDVLQRADEPNGFGALKPFLTSDEGQTYRDFKASLIPDYRRARIDLGLACSYILVTIACLVAVRGVLAGPLIAIFGTVAIGFFFAHEQLFLHAAAHYNLDVNRRRNDWISNVFVGILSGQEIKSYRTTHFKHHNLHGSTNDTEHSYFNSLSLGYLLRLCTGIEVLRVIRARRATRAPSARANRTRASLVVLGSAIAFHAILLATLAWIDAWIALAWIGGLTIAFPFFAATRQVLEHRNSTANDRTDYFTIAHGPYTRIFEDGVFARTFGAAGFARHALHHWDSGVSYTNLAQMEEFLERTPMATELKARRTTYGTAFSTLFRWTLR